MRHHGNPITSACNCSAVIVSCAPDKVAELEAVLGDLPHRTAGRVTGADLRCTMDAKELFAVPVSELHSAYESLPERLA